MKLTEMGILAARQVSSGIDLTKFKNFKHIGNLDGFSIMKSDIVDYLVAIKLMDNNKDVCYFIGIEFGHNIQIKRTWTFEEYRNKGIMTKLYKKVFMDLDYNLISDSELSPESKSIWTKIIALFPHNIFLTTKELKSFKPITNINDYFTADKHLMILKHDETIKEAAIPSILFQTALKEYEI